FKVVSLPNLKIIDFSYGHTGSTHVSTAWTKTRLANEHCDLIEDGEWIWADSAYPAGMSLYILPIFSLVDVWIIAPYKKPERDLPDNEEFNKHVSRVCIRSEHAIRSLKGRFHSLKNLCLSISDKTSHILATYWVAACIGVHSFAMQCKECKWQYDNDVNSDLSAPKDPFIAEGLSSSSDSDVATTMPLPRSTIPATHLRAGKAHCENLKEKLFRSKARRAHHTACSCAE
ncbi:hypothetical protein L208DRAFT_1275302, partial [Tricholoma matsutake]